VESYVIWPCCFNFRANIRSSVVERSWIVCKILGAGDRGVFEHIIPIHLLDEVHFTLHIDAARPSETLVSYGTLHGVTSTWIFISMKTSNLVLHRHSLGKAEKQHENLSGYQVTLSRFEPNTFWIKVCSIIASLVWLARNFKFDLIDETLRIDGLRGWLVSSQESRGSRWRWLWKTGKNSGVVAHLPVINKIILWQ